MSFRITKPGFYLQRNGGKAEVFAEREGLWYGHNSEGTAESWRADGTYDPLTKSQWDLVSEWHDAPDPGPGWRLLEDGEEVQEGDETFNCGTDRKWSAAVTALVGKTAGHWAKKYPLHGPVFRRRVTPWTPTCELRWAPAKAGWREELQQKWTRGSETEWRPVQVAE